MYKGTLKDGDLDAFSEADVVRMQADIKRRQDRMLELYTVQNKINL